MFKQSISITVLSGFAALSLAIAGTAQAQEDVVRSANGVTWVEVNSHHAPPDFVHAKPMPLQELENWLVGKKRAQVRATPVSFDAQEFGDTVVF